MTRSAIDLVSCETSISMVGHSGNVIKYHGEVVQLNYSSWSLCPIHATSLMSEWHPDLLRVAANIVHWQRRPWLMSADATPLVTSIIFRKTNLLCNKAQVVHQNCYDPTDLRKGSPKAEHKLEDFRT